MVVVVVVVVVWGCVGGEGGGGGGGDVSLRARGKGCEARGRRVVWRTPAHPPPLLPAACTPRCDLPGSAAPLHTDRTVVLSSPPAWVGLGLGWG